MSNVETRPAGPSSKSPTSLNATGKLLFLAVISNASMLISVPLTLAEQTTREGSQQAALALALAFALGRSRHPPVHAALLACGVYHLTDQIGAPPPTQPGVVAIQSHLDPLDKLPLDLMPASENISSHSGQRWSIARARALVASSCMARGLARAKSSRARGRSVRRRRTIIGEVGHANELRVYL